MSRDSGRSSPTPRRPPNAASASRQTAARGRLTRVSVSPSAARPMFVRDVDSVILKLGPKKTARLRTRLFVGLIKHGPRNVVQIRCSAMQRVAIAQQRVPSPQVETD